MTLSAEATPTPGEKPFASLRELVGTVIDDRYEVRRLLGSGGMGAVYEATQLQLDRRVAIKILNPVFMHREEYVAQFMQEAKTASRIRHENVVQVLDFGKLDGGSVYSVMELLEGRDLARLLKRETKLPWPYARALLLQAIRGVKAAHAQGVIHRDIKPANLFLTRDPEDDREVLKVLDFGIARLQIDNADTAALTGTADLIGTPAFMAPELARGKRAGPRTEVYSLGVVAYQMITGQLPFRGESAFDALFRAATEPTPTLRSHDPTVPPAVEELVLRMLAKDPQDRFADMTTLYGAVAEIDANGCMRSGPITITGPQIAIPATDPHITRVAPRTTTTTRTRWLVAAIGAAALAGVAAFAPTRGDAIAATDPSTPAIAATDPEPIAAPPMPSPIAVAGAAEPTAPEIDPSSEIVIDVEDEPRSLAKPRVSRAPVNDTEVLRRIERRAKHRCRKQLGGAALTVTFGIGPRGEVLAARGNRSGPGADCVVGVLRGSRFAAGRMRKEVVSL